VPSSFGGHLPTPDNRLLVAGAGCLGDSGRVVCLATIVGVWVSGAGIVVDTPGPKARGTISGTVAAKKRHEVIGRSRDWQMLGVHVRGRLHGNSARGVGPLPVRTGSVPRVLAGPSGLLGADAAFSLVE
jgi:hypothetical protein